MEGRLEVGKKRQRDDTTTTSSNSHSNRHSNNESHEESVEVEGRTMKRAKTLEHASGPEASVEENEVLMRAAEVAAENARVEAGRVAAAEANELEEMALAARLARAERIMQSKGEGGGKGGKGGGRGEEGVEGMEDEGEEGGEEGEGEGEGEEDEDEDDPFGADPEESAARAAEREEAARNAGSAAVLKEIGEAEEEGPEEEYTEDGTKIEAFNLREEMEEGYFDSAGVYHLREEEGREDDVEGLGGRDAWLAEISEEVGKKQALLGKGGSGLTEATSSSSVFDAVGEEALTDDKVCRMRERLLELMQGGETPFVAMARAKEEGKGEAVDEITELTSILLESGGDHDIYSKTFEHIEADVAKMKQNRLAPPVSTTSTSSATTATCMWEYMISGSEDESVYGPYPTAQIREWLAYFTESDYAVKVRMVSGPGSTRNPKWVPVNLINFDRMR